jgi:hypothetical protein
MSISKSAASVSPATSVVLSDLSGLSEYGPAVSRPTPAPNAVPVACPDAFPGGVPLALTVKFVTPNPKKPGSAAHARYVLYPVAPFTLADALKVVGGPNRADFLYDVRKGYIVLG